MPIWSKEDTLKLLLLVLFVGFFSVALQQLFRAEARLNARGGGHEGREGRGGSENERGRKEGGGSKND